jgi:hypothetical protein
MICATFIRSINGKMTANAPKRHASQSDWFPYHAMDIRVAWQSYANGARSVLTILKVAKYEFNRAPEERDEHCDTSDRSNARQAPAASAPAA